MIASERGESERGKGRGRKRSVQKVSSCIPMFRRQRKSMFRGKRVSRVFKLGFLTSRFESTKVMYCRNVIGTYLFVSCPHVMHKYDIIKSVTYTITI